MAIEILPSSLQNIVQQNYLQREFHQSLESVLGYDSICDVEPFATQIGQTETRTRNGLFAPTTTPLDPSKNTNLDNGLTPQNFTNEQYTMVLKSWGATADNNLLTERVNIDSLVMQNAKNLGVQSQQSLDRLARNSIFDAYLSGNTVVTTTLGSPATTIAVDDIRGFTTAIQNGVVTPISVSNTMEVFVGAGAYTLTGYTVDASNTSKAFGGISGTLIFSSNVSVPNGTAGNSVVSYFAPTILRPNARASQYALQASDLLTMQLLRDGVTVLQNNAVPTLGGFYEIRLDNTSMNQLWSDPEFQLLYRGTGLSSEAYRKLNFFEMQDMRFIRTTEAPQQTNAASGGYSFANPGVKVHRPIISGAGSIIKGYFTGQESDLFNSMQDGVSIRTGEGYQEYYNDKWKVSHYVRLPLDRLNQIISQSWLFVGGYSVPTDVTANTQIIPTANNSYFKRSVVLETGSY